MDIRFQDICLHICFPLLLGMGIYYSFRSGSYLALSWLEEWDMGRDLVSGRQMFLVHGAWVPDWIRFSLPDGLWLYALLSSIRFLWRKQYVPHGLLWVWTAISASMMTEILQGFGLIRGTFDWYDLLAYGTSTALYITTFHHRLSFTLNPRKR